MESRSRALERELGELRKYVRALAYVVFYRICCNRRLYVDDCEDISGLVEDADCSDAGWEYEYRYDYDVS